jgi:NTP pyrophosphatase (non-canonical NTP hydrolase)
VGLNDTYQGFSDTEIKSTLNELSRLCHSRNERWYRNPATGEETGANDGEKFMLMVSEIAEAMEGHRKGLMDDKLPKRPMVEVELADALIRIFDYAGWRSLDLGSALVEKMEYNRNRLDHTNAARCAPGGKKY